MEVLFLCFCSDADPRDRSAPALALFARLPRAGVFCLLIRRDAAPFRSIAPWGSFSSGAHVLVLRDGIGHRRRLGFTRLVIAVDSGSRDWSPGSFRAGRFR